MNQEEHDMLVEAVVSIRHITKTVEEIKQESRERHDALRRDIKDASQESRERHDALRQDIREGNALLRQDINKVDGRLWSAARWSIVTGGIIIMVLVVMLWQLVLGAIT